MRVRALCLLTRDCRHLFLSDNSYRHTSSDEPAHRDIAPIDDDDDCESSPSDVEDAVAPESHFNTEIEGPELNVFSIGDVAHDMDGYYDVDGEDGKETADVNLDIEPNPDSLIENLVLSDGEDP